VKQKWSKGSPFAHTKNKKKSAKRGRMDLVCLQVIADYDKNNMVLQWKIFSDITHLYTFNIAGIITHATEAEVIDPIHLQRLWILFSQRKIDGIEMLNDQVLNLAYSTRFTIIIEDKTNVRIV
jgi:hypothetical protein